MKRFQAVVMALALGCAAIAQAETVLVVNPANKASVSLEDAERLFLGKVKTFPTGAAATPLNQTEASPAREAFDAAVLKKNASQLKAYWSKLIFTGKGNPPAEMDAGAVKSKVASDPSAIGYIDAAEVDGSVREVARF